MKHKVNCNCPICNNSIREERQYGALEVKDGVYVTFDAEEFSIFDQWMRNKKNGDKQPSFEEIVPTEDAPLQLVYGVLMLADKTDDESYIGKVKEYKNYAFISLADEKIYYSGYEDIELFAEKEVYNGFIPCAMLLRTSIDLEKKLDFGFGHTLFLKHSNQEIFDNILCRKFLFCIRDTEKNFVPEDAECWRKYINMDHMLENAKYLF